MDRCKVLIADNDTDFAAAATRALECDYDVVLAFSMERALAIAIETLPDLIIVGYLGPRGQAPALHEALRDTEITAYTPQLILDIDRRDPLRRSWRRADGLRMEAEGYLGPRADLQEIRQESARILAAVLERRSEWDSILRDTQRRMIHQAEAWTHTMADLMAESHGALVGSAAG